MVDQWNSGTIFFQADFEYTCPDWAFDQNWKFNYYQMSGREVVLENLFKVSVKTNFLFSAQSMHI